MSRLATLLVVGLIQLYRVTFSPLLAAVGVRCRHEPSCSQYALDAVRKHGAWAGGWMAAARLSRCHPWGSHGFDPAPGKRQRAPWWAPWRQGDWRGPSAVDANGRTMGAAPAASVPDPDRNHTKTTSSCRH